MRKVVWTLGLAVTFLAGCGTTQIAHKMKGGGPAPSAAVALKVIDARPSDKGGTEKVQVGQVRGSYGIPSSVKDASPDVATRTVTDATTDALSQAAIGVKADAGKTLVATVKHFWMDGFQGYKATVAVHYELQDSSGKVLWSSDVSGGAGGALIFKSPESMANDLFVNALADLANKAADKFRAADFQKALAS